MAAGRRPLEVDAVETELSPPRGEAENRVEQRGLSRAVRSDDPGDASRFHVQGNAVQGTRLSVERFQVLHFE